MKITRDRSIEKWAEEEVVLNWGKEAREGIHLSDLLSPRKAYWQRILPKNPTIDEILYWTSGNAIEDKLLRAIKYQKGETKEWFGILYSPDVFFNFPAEIKSRRRNLAKEGEEEKTYDTYIEQVRGYCAFSKSTQAWLLVVSLLERQVGYTTKPELAIYRLEFTEDELEQERQRLTHTKELLEKALTEQKIDDLPFCRTWMCYKENKIVIEVSKCLDCDKEIKTKRSLVKHEGHKIQEAKIETKIEPRCKWFSECRIDLKKDEAQCGQ